MIKINLLPKTINEKRAVQQVAILFGILVVAIIVGGFTFTMKLRADVNAMEEEAANVKAWRTRVESIESEASKIRSSIGPVKQKTDFINAVLDYNQKFPKLYEEIAKWTYEKVSYTSVQCNAQGTHVVMQARVKTLDDLGRYLMNMYRATDLFTSVTISGVPGYPSSKPTSQRPRAEPDYEESQSAPSSALAGLEAIEEGVRRDTQEQWIDFTVTCALKQPIVPPAFAGASAASAGPRSRAPGRGPSPRDESSAPMSEGDPMPGADPMPQ